MKVGAGTELVAADEETTTRVLLRAVLLVCERVTVDMRMRTDCAYTSIW